MAKLSRIGAHLFSYAGLAQCQGGALGGREAAATPSRRRVTLRPVGLLLGLCVASAVSVGCGSSDGTEPSGTGSGGSGGSSGAGVGGGSAAGDGGASGSSGGASGSSGGASGSSGGASGASGSGGGSAGSGAAGSAGGGAVEAKICEEPTPLPLPATSKVVGTGTPDSCTEAALRTALSGGGHVTFDCGASPLTLALGDVISITAPTVLEGGDMITLDAGGTHRILDVATGASLSVRQLRFINGKAADTMEPEGIGGAIAGEWRSEVEVIGCTFEDNAAARGGGAVSVWTGSRLTVVSSRFERNHSWYGGALYSLLSPLTVIDSDFVDNSNLTENGMGEGGAIGTDGASESPDDAVGGAVEICGCRFTGNQGYGCGGAAYIWVYPPDTVLIDRTVVSGNAVGANTGGGAIGGGMRISNGAITIQQSTFDSNQSLANGGGLYLDCEPTCDITNSVLRQPLGHLRRRRLRGRRELLPGDVLPQLRRGPRRRALRLGLHAAAHGVRGQHLG